MVQLLVREILQGNLVILLLNQLFLDSFISVDHILITIILETVIGSNGIIMYPKNYLKGVRKICDEFGIVMICDEVMAGWYRTGKMFAYMIIAAFFVIRK